MIITLTGNNDFQRSQALSEQVANYVDQYGDIGLERYDGDDLDPKRLPSILQAQPFLAAKRLVVLRSPSSQKVVQEELEKLLGSVTDTTDLVIVEPKLDKRTGYYKTLQKQTDFRQFDQPSENQLADWLISQAQSNQGSLSPADARYLISRVGPNQQLLANELQKLIDFAPKIDRQAIDMMTEPTPQSSIFDLLDAALNNRTKQLLAIYHDQRQQKVEPLAILALLAWQLHILALLKTAGDRSPQTIAKEAGLSPFVVQKSQAIARRLDLSTIKNWVAEAARLDIRLKSQPLDADEALQHFLLTLS